MDFILFLIVCIAFDSVVQVLLLLSMCVHKSVAIQRDLCFAYSDFICTYSSCVDFTLVLLLFPSASLN